MAGLFALAALAFRGGVKAVGAAKNYKERNTYSNTYALGKYTNERYYYDYNGHTRLCSTNQQIIYLQGRYVDTHYNVIYDEREEERKRMDKKTSMEKVEESTVYFKHNYGIHDIYPFVYEKKTGKNICQLIHMFLDGKTYYGIRYWDGHTKCECYSPDAPVKEITEEYYNKLKNDIENEPSKYFDAFTALRVKSTVEFIYEDNKELWKFLK